MNKIGCALFTLGILLILGVIGWGIYETKGLLGVVLFVAFAMIIAGLIMIDAS